MVRAVTSKGPGGLRDSREDLKLRQRASSLFYPWVFKSLLKSRRRYPLNINSREDHTMAGVERRRGRGGRSVEQDCSSVAVL